MPFTTRTTLATVAAALGLMACADSTAPIASRTPAAALMAKGPKSGGGDDDADGGSGQTKVTICHVGDDGAYVMITVGAPGAANHLLKHAGDTRATMRNGSYTCPARSGPSS